MTRQSDCDIERPVVEFLINLLLVTRSKLKSWKTFLRNHAAGIASIDLFVVRTISFKLLYGLVILRHARRRLVSISVTDNPTAEWIAGQVTDAFPWEEALRHLIRDRDGAFGPVYTRRIRARTGSRSISMVCSRSRSACCARVSPRAGRSGCGGIGACGGRFGASRSRWKVGQGTSV